MKAWLLDKLGGLDQIHLRDVPDPVPGEGEVTLAVRYAALNPADRYLAEGQYPARPPLPHILGRDGMGTVAGLGSGVAGFHVGQKLVVLRGEAGVTRPGTFAERVAVPVESLVPVPAGWDETQAACATLVYMTAYQALTQWGDLPAGSVVLVTGASGGVGVATVQLGAAMGLAVIGLSRSAEKQETLRGLGAVAAFDPQDTQWRRRVKEFLAAHHGGRRVDLVVDNIGGALFGELLDTLGEQGKVSVVGRLAGPVPQFNTASLFFRRLRIGGVAVGSYANADARAAWSAVVASLDRAGRKPLVDRVFPFEQLPKAFDRMAAGPMGKVVLAVSG